MITTLLFDFDDTLGNRDVYTYQNYSDYIEKIAPRLSALEKEAVKQDCMLYDMRGNISKRFVIREVCKKYGLQSDPDEFSDYWSENAGIYAVTFPEVKETLAELRHHYRLACLTNGPQKSQMAKIVQAGLAESFDLIVTGGELNAQKPQRDIYEYALRKLHATAKEALFIGDTFSTDILGALRLGIRSVWIADKRRPCSFPIERIEHIRELKEILKNA